MAEKKDLPLVEPIIEKVHPEVESAEDSVCMTLEERIEYLEQKIKESYYEIARLKEELKVTARENLALKEYKELFELATQSLDNIDNTINLFSKSLGILFKKGGNN